MVAGDADALGELLTAPLALTHMTHPTDSATAEGTGTRV